jgi:hypothetical protein
MLNLNKEGIGNIILRHLLTLVARAIRIKTVSQQEQRKNGTYCQVTLLTVIA